MANRTIDCPPSFNESLDELEAMPRLAHYYVYHWLSIDYLRLHNNLTNYQNRFRKQVFAAHCLVERRKTRPNPEWHTLKQDDGERSYIGIDRQDFGLIFNEGLQRRCTTTP